MIHCPNSKPPPGTTNTADSIPFRGFGNKRNNSRPIFITISCCSGSSSRPKKDGIGKFLCNRSTRNYNTKRRSRVLNGFIFQMAIRYINFRRKAMQYKRKPFVEIDKIFFRFTNRREIFEKKIEAHRG